MSQAWIKFYPTDWCGDRALRSCSLGARGLWLEMLSIMNDAEPRGSLLINGKPINPGVNPTSLATIAGSSKKEVKNLFEELDSAGVFSRDPDGTIFSRRMRRDDEKAKKDKDNGGKGGNPKLKRPDKPSDNRQANSEVNPPDKAHMPEARVQKEERKKDGAESAKFPLDPNADLYDFGKSFLGKGAGGLITNLKNLYGGDIARTRAFLETARTRQDAVEYVAATIKRSAGKSNHFENGLYDKGL